jgi:hypothetical protein
VVRGGEDRVVTIVALTFLLLTILALATGNYGGHSALVH